MNNNNENKTIFIGAYPVGFSQDDNPRAIPVPPVPEEWKNHAPILGDLIREVLRLRVQRLYDHKRLSEVTTIINGRIQICSEIARQQNDVIQRVIDKQDAVLQYARTTSHLMYAIINDIAKGQITRDTMNKVTETIRQGHAIESPKQRFYGTRVTAKRIQDNTLNATVQTFDTAEGNTRKEMKIPDEVGYEQFRDRDYGVQLDPSKRNIRRHPIPSMNEQPWQYDPSNNTRTCLMAQDRPYERSPQEPMTKRTRTEQQTQMGNDNQYPQEHGWQTDHWQQDTYEGTATTENNNTIIF